MKLSAMRTNTIRGGRVQLNGFYFIYFGFCIWCILQEAGYLGGMWKQLKVEVSEVTLLRCGLLHMGQNEDDVDVKVVCNRLEMKRSLIKDDQK